ncbi:hypothetical protein [Leptospira kmetyi]|uniref:hypothetical protein n=1 Tax=Leptospira kmetyi TaxID=408139 RepID=UPI003EBCD7B7
MDSNTGQSSGGHTGLRIGNKVYHYQFFPDDIFHLVRESYDDFAFSYNIVSNRTSILTRLKLDPKEISVLESGLNRLYLVQFRHLQNLELLKKETKFFEELNSPEKKIGLRATAYFTFKERSPISKNIKSEIVSLLGEDFLSDLEHTLEYQLYSPKSPLERIEFPPLPEKMTRDRFPFFKPGSFLNLRDALEGIVFCRILREEWAANPEFKISNIQNSLNPKEIELLKNFYKKQILSLAQIVSERDPGWGYSGLVTLGRLHAIEESLRTGYPVFLSSFPENSPIVYREDKEDQKALDYLSEENWSVVSLARKKISEINELTEKEYQIWEDATNRAFELKEGIDNSIPVRVTSGKLIPERENKFLLPIVFPEETVLAEYLKHAKQRETEYHVRLKKLYPFHLLFENCTTEIIRSVQNSFDAKENPFPGEKINFDYSIAFIPFHASHSVSKNWNSTGQTTLLSYRRRKLSELLQKDPSFKNSLRESFTFSSTIYKPNREDHFFPLFTDDVFWLRPIYGTVNLGAGLGATTIGIFTSPFDKGERFQKGFQSLFFSFPEFVFFNIRKGTFPAVSMREIPEEIFRFQDED